MHNRYLPQRSPTYSPVYGTIAVVVLCLLIATWPASLAFLLVLLVWSLTSEKQAPIARSLHEAAQPVLIGTGVFWAAALMVSLSQWFGLGSESLFESEQWLLEVRREVHAFTSPNLTLFLLLLAMLLAWLYFFPESKAIGRLLRAKKGFARLHLCLLAITSFTLFGGSEADKLADRYK